MSQNTSDIQAIEKFSFIDTLTHSKDKHSRQVEKKVSVDIQQGTDKSHQEQAHQLVHSSLSDSVTLSSILGFPDFAATNGSSLSLLKEPIYHYALDLPEQLKLSAEKNSNGGFIFRHLGKIILALSSSYLLFVTWWLTGHSYYGKIFPFSALRPLLNISEQQISAADLEFIDYMERSLASIEHKQETELSNAATQPENSEVVYIPVYNLANVNSASQTNPSHTTFPLNSSVSNSPLPIPVIPPPPPTEVPTSNSSSSFTTSTGKSTTETLPSAVPSSPVNTNASSNSTQSPPKDHTLIGIVELGDRSAALVKVNGVTKRIWVGEKLDNKGWILDSVANQKAKIIHQGTIRYLSVGEKF